MAAGVRPGRARRFHDAEGAQAVLEFAILGSIVIFLVLGTFDFARLMYYQSAISSAARVGAESASNHCASAALCGIAGAPTTYDYVLQATTCEAPDVPLKPAVPCSQVASAAGSPCSGTCPPACSQDVCVSPAFAPGSTQILAAPEDVTVSVGFDFTPITPLILPFLQSDLNSAWKNGCFPGDPPHTHTLCAKVTGRAE